MGNFFSFFLVLALGFACGMLAAPSCNSWGPFAYVSAVKVLVWDYSSITLAFQYWTGIPLYTTLCASIAVVAGCVIKLVWYSVLSNGSLVPAQSRNGVWQFDMVESECCLVMLRTKLSLRHNAC